MFMYFGFEWSLHQISVGAIMKLLALAPAGLHHTNTTSTGLCPLPAFRGEVTFTLSLCVQYVETSGMGNTKL